MSTDVEERPAAEPAPQAPSELVGADLAREQLRTRVLLPVLIPLLAMVTLAVLAINISRVFLAGSNVVALITATVITLSILGGGALISSKPALRTSSLTLIGSLVVLVVIGAGLTTLGAADEHGEGSGGGYQQPEGDPDTTLEVAANANLTFTPSDPSVPAGIVEIDLTCAPGCGNHTFLFDDSQFSGFELAVPPESDAGKVEIAEGSYDFYCSIPGHRAAGMEGTLSVTAAAPGGDGAGAGDEGTTPTS